MHYWANTAQFTVFLTTDLLLLNHLLYYLLFINEISLQLKLFSICSSVDCATTWRARWTMCTSTASTNTAFAGSEEMSKSTKNWWSKSGKILTTTIVDSAFRKFTQNNSDTKSVNHLKMSYVFVIQLKKYTICKNIDEKSKTILIKKLHLCYFMLFSLKATSWWTIFYITSLFTLKSKLFI